MFNKIDDSNSSTPPWKRNSKPTQQQQQTKTKQHGLCWSFAGDFAHCPSFLQNSHPPTRCTLLYGEDEILNETTIIFGIFIIKCTKSCSVRLVQCEFCTNLYDVIIIFLAEITPGRPSLHFAIARRITDLMMIMMWWVCWCFDVVQQYEIYFIGW